MRVCNDIEMYMISYQIKKKIVVNVRYILSFRAFRGYTTQNSHTSRNSLDYSQCITKKKCI